MAISGARGSMDNLNMMAGSIGQAKVRGKRLGTWIRRPCSTSLQAWWTWSSQTVVSSPVHSSVDLKPTEFFMLSVSGRESLVDTAVRTAKSGYMQRRLINAMDDLKVYRRRNALCSKHCKRIIQFSYGEDGIDPSRGVHGSPFNIDVIVDAALGTDG